MSCPHHLTSLQATGALGTHIAAALSENIHFDLTVLVRPGYVDSLSKRCRVIEVNYESDESLFQALQGQDVLVSALGKTALSLQGRLVDAAVIAGIRRIIPSEFGANLTNPLTRKFPTYRPKVLVEEQLEQYRQQRGISYTFIYCNCLLDWGLSHPGRMLLDPNERSIRLYDGGNVKFSTTSMPTVAKAVVAVLDHYQETANRHLFIHDVVITQNELLTMAREVTAGDGGKEWDILPVDTAQAEVDAYENFKLDPRSQQAFYAFAARGAFGEGYGGCFRKNDNELLGIPEMDLAQVKEIVRACVT